MGFKEIIKEKIIKSPIIWFLNTLLIAFLAGIGAYQGILEIAQLKVVSKNQLSHENKAVQNLLTSKKFPRKDGVIANFKTGGGGPARNVFGEVFNILSDNEWNGSSKCWYQLKSEKDRNSGINNKFIQLYYQLAPREVSGGESYIGLFTDFSPPPTTTFDISDFSGITLSLRLGQKLELTKTSVHISLASSNNKPLPGSYDFPSAAIEPYYLKKAHEGWTVVKIPFTSFVPPEFSNRNVSLDTKKVFRLVVSLVSSLNKKQHGHIDIDDIRFY